jgi:hypothetical protein
VHQADPVRFELAVMDIAETFPALAADAVGRRALRIIASRLLGIPTA